MITPPGHIYVRYRNGDKIINIETTARGINMDSEEYLSVETRSLQERNIKEVIGLAYFNQASVFWQREEHDKALAAYNKAKPYIPNDKLLFELMGYNYLFAGDRVEGERLLEIVRDHIPEYAIVKQTVAEDYLNGKVNAEGIKALFLHVDEKRESIIKKKETLEKILLEYPNFRAGIFSLGITWLQLHRAGEALEILQRYHDLEPQDPSAEYYLSVLQAERLNYKKAWEHLRHAEAIVAARRHKPKVLKELRRALSKISPEP